LGRPIGPRIEFRCEECGNPFYTRPSETTNRRDGTPRRYCSLPCSRTARKIPIQDRFWDKVAIGAPDECWPWQANIDGWGYGTIRGDGKIERSNRVAFFLTHGYWPNVCRHTCDNPPCCNPKHLLDGTHADNSLDRSVRGVKRGRYAASRHV
jgi:hypothetical protein